MKQVYVGVIVLVIVAVLSTVARHVGVFDGSVVQHGESVVVHENVVDELSQNHAQEDREDVDYRVEVVIQDLFVPWSIVFTDMDRMLVTERNGDIREIVSGRLTAQPLLSITDISTQSEEGLMGLVRDPGYVSNKYLYTCYAYPNEGGLADRVVRLVDRGEAIEIDETVIDNIPAAQFHAGCRVKFGPDEKLYITTGDATQKELAQQPDSRAGKILRINADGSIPEDNPFEGSPVYSLGHRNPQGIDWHPNGIMFSTEHGPSGFDGPGGGDEVNIIRSGENYGWPIVSHERSDPRFIDPLLVYTPAEAPGSALVYTGDVFPQFFGNLFFGALRGEGIMRVVLGQENPEEVISYEKLHIEVGRVREVMQGPDGYIYFTTSNRDGRGKVREGDDVIYRLVPALED